MQTVNMKLTKNEIDWLYQATKKEYVYYLNENECLLIEDSPKSLREKLVKLSAGSFLEFDAIIKFYETKYFLTQND